LTAPGATGLMAVMSQSSFTADSAQIRAGLDIEAFLARLDAALASSGEPEQRTGPWELASLAAGAVLALGAIFGAGAGAALGEALGSALGACLT
jgi:hypothetical protein